MIDVPDVVKSYFDASNRGDVEEVIGSFQLDACIEDQSGRYDSIDLIRRWWISEQQKNYHAVEPFQSVRLGENVSVCALTEVANSAEPVVRNFFFILQGDKISRLEIE